MGGESTCSQAEPGGYEDFTLSAVVVRGEEISVFCRIALYIPSVLKIIDAQPVLLKKIWREMHMGIMHWNLKLLSNPSLECLIEKVK